jgi:prevent-host-death family protein
MSENVWQLQDAKARFSELVERAINDGPQVVTRRGMEAVVVVSAEEFRRAAANPRPVDFFRREPFIDDLELQRDRSLPRGVQL